MYNRVLTDVDRKKYTDIIAQMYRYVPEMAHNKIGTAIVQQAFVVSTTMRLLHDADVGNYILSAGSYQDTAAELLRLMGYSVYDVDPVINCDLHTFCQRWDGKYSAVISTSVLEHTINDEEFIADSCQALMQNGIGVFTMDFKDDWIPGQPVPYTSNRFYTTYDLTVRLRNILLANDCDFVDTPDYTAQDTFVWDGINYSFATFVFKKG